LHRGDGGAGAVRSGADDELRAGMRRKHRQYVNKARTGGVTVVDASGDRLGEFYRIYRDTADRAGFLIRAESAYRDVWDAFAPTGNARLLFAQAADGEPQATLFLVRSGPRVVEPYGGMTAAGPGREVRPGTLSHTPSETRGGHGRMSSVSRP